MKRAPYDRRDGQPAASAARRLPVRRSCGARFVCTFVITVIAACVALVPVSVDVGSVRCPAPGVNVHKNQALAVTPVDGSGLLSNLASVAGLSTGDFVATSAGIIGIASGMVIAKNEGAKLGATASYNLSALIDAADYPDYNYLTEEQKQLWGSKENYDAAKFNSLMTAVGLGDYVTGYYASGGSNFEGTPEQLGIIRDIGAIGQTWLDRGSVLYEDIKALNVQKSKVSTWAGAGQIRVDASGADGWPDTIPRDLELGSGDMFIYSKTTTYAFNVYKLTNKQVYWLNYLYRYNGTLYLRTMAFSESPFSFNFTSGKNAEPPANASTFTANEYTADGHTYYQWSNSTRSNSTNSNIDIDAPAYCNMPVHTALTDDSDYNAQVAETDTNIAIPIILFGAQVNETVVPEIPSYPGADQVSDNTPLYYPDDGVSPTTNWQDYVTEPETPPTPEPRPENPYNPTDPDNPGYQSGTPEWKQDTTDNLEQALRINFEKLFPFCLIYDLKMFVDKFRELVLEDTTGIGEQAINDYEILRLPGLPIDGLENGMEFDLEPLRNLLNMIRPIVFWVLLVNMLMSVIEFWRGILTGGD